MSSSIAEASHDSYATASLYDSESDHTPARKSSRTIPASDSYSEGDSSDGSKERVLALNPLTSGSQPEPREINAKEEKNRDHIYEIGFGLLRESEREQFPYRRRSVPILITAKLKPTSAIKGLSLSTVPKLSPDIVEKLTSKNIRMMTDEQVAAFRPEQFQQLKPAPILQLLFRLPNEARLKALPYIEEEVFSKIKRYLTDEMLIELAPGLTEAQVWMTIRAVDIPTMVQMIQGMKKSQVGWIFQTRMTSTRMRYATLALSKAQFKQIVSGFGKARVGKILIWERLYLLSQFKKRYPDEVPEEIARKLTYEVNLTSKEFDQLDKVAQKTDEQIGELLKLNKEKVKLLKSKGVGNFWDMPVYYTMIPTSS